MSGNPFCDQAHRDEVRANLRTVPGGVGCDLWRALDALDEAHPFPAAEPEPTSRISREELLGDDDSAGETNGEEADDD
ncbi:MAG: hypothetical protein ACE5FA_12910 [Dehalococcoidia bacterium]